MPERKAALFPPSRATLRKYGLSEAEWRDICRRQGGCCPICGGTLVGRPLAVDHAHVAGFRAHKVRRGRRVRAMPPADRKRHVRGVLHSYCNRLVRKWLTRELAAAVLRYLEEHERRAAKCG